MGSERGRETEGGRKRKKAKRLVSLKALDGNGPKSFLKLSKMRPRKEKTGAKVVNGMALVRGNQRRKRSRNKEAGASAEVQAGEGDGRNLEAEVAVRAVIGEEDMKSLAAE